MTEQSTAGEPGFLTDASDVPDELGRASFAERITDALAGQPGDTSLVVGLYGPWGSGKSTILDYVRTNVEQHYDPKSVILVKFNPWFHDSEEGTVRDFFATIARAIGESLEGDFAEAGRRLTRLGEIAKSLSFGHAGGQFSGSLVSALGSFFNRERNLRELREHLECLLNDEMTGLRDVRIIEVISATHFRADRA